MSTFNQMSFQNPASHSFASDVSLQSTINDADASFRSEQSSFVNGSFHHGPSLSQDHTQQATSAAPTMPNLSNLVCNVTRLTGKRPPALVGASTTIVGDKLFVFGGRRLSRRRPHLTQHLYELDLISRHWTRIETTGSIPAQRYFHSMCALGETKLVCYGGMAPTASGSDQHDISKDAQADPAIMVMSDIHVYDIATKTWTHVQTSDPPPGRYAHCATILPSSGIFTSASAAHSALLHNQSSGIPNQGSLGVAIDGKGGAELIVIGGQDRGSNYIEQISVFNFRSLRWTSTTPIGKTCGAYRSVAAPFPAQQALDIGNEHAIPDSEDSDVDGYATLLYSNYNFLNVQLELQVRFPDGRLEEKVMRTGHSPPGLRFPNGGVINGHFIVSGTFLTSSKQEYAMWALDLSSMAWSRIDIGGGLFSSGSWNRGIVWNRKNSFVVLGDVDRKLQEDYNHRRINFKHMCFVELEAFGLYENPRATESHGVPTTVDTNPSTDVFASGRLTCKSASKLGQMMAAASTLR